MAEFDKTTMDDAANDALIDLEKIKGEYPDGVQSIEDWVKKWVPSAGYKRLAKILAGRWEQNTEFRKYIMYHEKLLSKW